MVLGQLLLLSLLDLDEATEVHASLVLAGKANTFLSHLKLE
jgi:hypothetical protein